MKSKLPPITRPELVGIVAELNQKFGPLAILTLEEKVFDGEPSFSINTVLQGDADSGSVWRSLYVLKTLYRNVGYSVSRGDP